MFYQPNNKALEQDLVMIENDIRSQYRMTYKIPELKRDGSFHRIKLECPAKRCEVLTRSGYYAATRH